MAAPGRGRGTSKNVEIVDEIDPRVEINRQDQLEAARLLGMSEGDIPIRGRGGFRQTELRTIPDNVTAVRAQNVAGARQVDICTNYVNIIPMANRVVQMYRVDFEPAVESDSLMGFLFRTAAGQLFKRRPIYDGVHECRSGQELPEKVTSVTIADPQRDNQQFKVTFTNTGTSGFGSEFTRTYNMHMKSFLRALGFYQPQIGIYVHPDHHTPVGNDIMMMRGFRTSANMNDGNQVCMLLEPAHKIVQRKNVLEIIAQLTRANRSRDAISAELVGKVVVTSYNKRVYRIEEILYNENPTMTFDRNGQQVSFVDYFREAHNKQITDLKQPLIKAVPNNQRNRDQVTKEAKLPPELCNLAGLTDQQRVDNRLKMDLIRASQVAPNERVQHLRRFLESFHNNQEIKEQLSSWGYQYGKDVLRIKAHVLAMTGYACGRTISEPLPNYTKADLNSADIRPDALAVTPKIAKMAIIITRIDIPQKNLILSTLRSGFDKIRLHISNVDIIEMAEGDSAQAYSQRIRNIANDVTVAIVIMHGQNKERYDAIKKAASVNKGLITQVVTARLIVDPRKGRSAATKIAIQVAAKVGGEPWWVDLPLKKSCVIGYDVYHDTAQRGRSFGAFVASLNVRYSRWWSKADTHDRLEEISSQMAANITEAMKVYRENNNGELPERVMFFRDGVGEGQLEHVFKVELKQIKNALDAISPRIKLTMTIVNKRVGAKFYMRAAEGFANPPPGTVIDHTVTRQERYDFYLISQSTRQGTVTPTYYNIIHDEASFPPEIHQRLAFKLCLLYYNWSGTVRVPAPCQYAHKLAFLCGEHLHAQPNSNMDDKLHYL